MVLAARPAAGGQVQAAHMCTVPSSAPLKRLRRKADLCSVVILELCACVGGAEEGGAGLVPKGMRQSAQLTQSC